MTSDGSMTPEMAPVAAARGGLRGLGDYLHRRGVAVEVRDLGILVAFVALFTVLSVASSAFLTGTNLSNILDQQADIAIMAIGGTLVIVAGGFDLSVGAVYALAAVVAAKVAGLADPAFGLLAGILVGVGCGLVNGVLASYVRINPFVTTLATGIGFRGLALVVTGGVILIVEDPGFQAIGTGEALGLTWATWIFLGFALACGFLLSRTTFGRYVYAAGGNPEAARLSGVRVERVRAITFVISGAAAGLAGVLAASAVGSAQADLGLGLELSVIAAIVIGGTSILGGEGAIWRTVVGVFILAMIGNGFNLLSLDASYQSMVRAGIILLAVGADVWLRRRR